MATFQLKKQYELKNSNKLHLKIFLKTKLEVLIKQQKKTFKFFFKSNKYIKQIRNYIHNIYFLNHFSVKLILTIKVCIVKPFITFT